MLEAVADAWAHRRDEIGRHAEELTAAVATGLGPTAPASAVPGAAELIDQAVERFAASFDAEHGGVGGAPKFPQAPMLELLLRAHELGRPGALRDGDGDARGDGSGGIYDQLGGGFARYSVDRRWLVPHFEKMAYDQAALSRCYLHAWQLTGDVRWRQVVDETLGYLLAVLRDPAGGVRSSEDADSEGEEGRFYLWTPGEVEHTLDVAGFDGDVAAVIAWYGLDGKPNFKDDSSALVEGRYAATCSAPTRSSGRAASSSTAGTTRPSGPGRQRLDRVERRWRSRFSPRPVVL